jgi:hypothetical protein
MRVERIFFLISAPISLMTTYQMNLISAGSISLDSTFKHFISSNITCKVACQESEPLTILSSPHPLPPRMATALKRALVSIFKFSSFQKKKHIYFQLSQNV